MGVVSQIYGGYREDRDGGGGIHVEQSQEGLITYREMMEHFRSVK